MRAKIVDRKWARCLRKKGYSFSEISRILGVAKSSASKWAGDIKLDEAAVSRIDKIRRDAVLKVSRLNREKARKRQLKGFNWVKSLFVGRDFSVFEHQLIASLLYWGEGAKFSNRVEFTNSDPEMVKLFIKSLKRGFMINISEIRANLHLHSYHNEKKQKCFWSNELALKLGQFNKTFWKQSGVGVRPNYPGCIRICYHSKDVVDKIKAFYQVLSKEILGS